MRELSIKSYIYKKLLTIHRKRNNIFANNNLEVLLISFVEGGNIIKYPELSGISLKFAFVHKRGCVKDLLSKGYIKNVKKNRYKLTLSAQFLCKSFMTDFAAELLKYNITL